MKRYVIPADKVWQAHKPKYNGFACGHGAHRNKKAYRRKPKHQRDLSYEQGSAILMLGLCVFLAAVFMHALFF